jgi:hypothetical protein
MIICMVEWDAVGRSICTTQHSLARFLPPSGLNLRYKGCVKNDIPSLRPTLCPHLFLSLFLPPLPSPLLPTPPLPPLADSSPFHVSTRSRWAEQCILPALRSKTRPTGNVKGSAATATGAAKARGRSNPRLGRARPHRRQGEAGGTGDPAATATPATARGRHGF